MALRDEDAIIKWVDHIVRPEGISKERRVGYNGNTMKVDRETGILSYDSSPRGATAGTERQTREMARFLRKRKVFLINGDGFASQPMTNRQTELRRAIEPVCGIHDMQLQQQGGWFRRDEATIRIEESEYQRIILPYLALEAGNIDFDSIRPIDVSIDRFQRIARPFPIPPADTQPPDSFEPNRGWAPPQEFSWEGRRYQGNWRADESSVQWFIGDESVTQDGADKHRLEQRERYRHRDFGATSMTTTGVVTFTSTGTMSVSPTDVKTPEPVVEKDPNVSTDGRSLDLDTRHEYTKYVLTTRDVSMWDTDSRGNGGWRRQEFVGATDAEVDAWVGRQNARNPDPHSQIKREDITPNTWVWVEEIHHLGASVFSAVGEDGRRHKFVSAFDQNEPQPMYFLAQLPDGSGAETYEEAIESLAPPMVKKAREDGKTVHRQGDVFAIETSKTDEQVYASARTRVRREVVLTRIPEETLIRYFMAQRQNPDAPVPSQIVEAGEGEVSGEVFCPCGCGVSIATAGNGEAARRALSIYGTGHSATEVVVATNGATYIKGTMHHDPVLEEPGRLAEHIDVPLLAEDGTSRPWFLAVRNTVPRRSRRRQTNEEEE